MTIESKAFSKLISGKILYDITEISKNLERTGIQRTTVEIASKWPEKNEIIPFVWISSNEINLIDPKIFGLLNNNFRKEISSLKTLSEVLHTRETTNNNELDIFELLAYPIATLSAENAFQSARAILNTELFYDRERINKYKTLIDDWSHKIFFLIYDFLPWIYPQYFDGFNISHNKALIDWILLTRALQNIAFISDKTRQDYLERINKNPNNQNKNLIVTPLGSDGLSFKKPRTDTILNKFLVLGSLEPRKNSLAIAELFNNLTLEHPEICVQFVGKIVQYSETQVSQFKELLATNRNIRWERYASDEDLSVLIRTCTASIYLSSCEGYGLPILESLACGTPIISSKNIPVNNYISTSGQIRIDPNNIEELKEAVLRINTIENITTLQNQISNMELPLWQDTALSIRKWILKSLDETDITTSTTPIKDLIAITSELYSYQTARREICEKNVENLALLHNIFFRRKPSFCEIETLRKNYKNHSSFMNNVRPTPFQFLFYNKAYGLIDDSNSNDFLLCIETAQQIIHTCKDNIFAENRKLKSTFDLFIQFQSLITLQRNIEFIRGCYSLILHVLPNSTDIIWSIGIIDQSNRWNFILSLLAVISTDETIKEKYLTATLKEWINILSTIEDLKRHNTKVAYIKAYNFFMNCDPDISEMESIINSIGSGVEIHQILLSILLSPICKFKRIQPTLFKYLIRSIYFSSPKEFRDFVKLRAAQDAATILSIT